MGDRYRLRNSQIVVQVMDASVDRVRYTSYVSDDAPAFMHLHKGFERARTTQDFLLTFEYVPADQEIKWQQSVS